MNRQGRSTLLFNSKPRIHSWASIVGSKEGMGPLGHTFDVVLDEDDTVGEESWEKAERKIATEAIKLALEKGGKALKDVQVLLSGDLLNQIITASFVARELEVPYLGVYNACSTMAETLLIGSALVDGGFANCAVCSTSSHFSTAERQYRMPLELGTQRTPTAQWTVTGSGCTVLCDDPAGICVTKGTIGRVVDLGVCDANNMGAAMAPAAADTLLAHFTDTGTCPSSYDIIATGDLGSVGMNLMRELMSREGYPLGSNYIDCGCEVFSPSQDTHSGGSGCGCGASVLNGYLLGKLMNREINNLLFIATGALLSTTSSQQGESIPCIAHAVAIEGG